MCKLREIELHVSIDESVDLCALGNVDVLAVHEQKERSSRPKYQRCDNDRTPFPLAVPEPVAEQG